MGDNVTVTHRGDRDDRPPDPESDAGEILRVDDRDNRSRDRDHERGEQRDVAEAFAAGEHAFRSYRPGAEHAEARETHDAEQPCETKRGQEGRKKRWREHDNAHLEPMRAERGSLSWRDPEHEDELDEKADPDEPVERRGHRLYPVTCVGFLPQHAANVKEELPSPRTVEVAPADIVFQDGLDIELGGVTVRVRHVGGNHSAESSVMYVEPDRVLFLGDCLSDSPEGVLTAELAFPLHDAILRFDAELYVEGHHESVSSRAEIESLIEKMRLAEKAGREGSAIAVRDEDTEYFVQAFKAGRATAS